MMITLNLAIALGLFLTAVLLFLAVQFRLISDQALQRVTNVGGSVAAVAAVLIMVLPPIADSAPAPAATQNIQTNPPPSAAGVATLPPNPPVPASAVESSSGNEEPIKVGDFVQVRAVREASGVNLRASPSVEGLKKATVPFNTLLQVIGEPQNGWWQVRSPFNFLEGWVASVTADGKQRILVKATLPAAPQLKPGAYGRILAVRGYQGLNLRQSATTDSEVLQTLPFDSIVQITGEPHGIWWPVKPLLGEQTGWIATYSWTGQLNLSPTSAP